MGKENSESEQVTAKMVSRIPSYPCPPKIVADNTKTHLLDWAIASSTSLTDSWQKKKSTSFLSYHLHTRGLPTLN